MGKYIAVISGCGLLVLSVLFIDKAPRVLELSLSQRLLGEAANLLVFKDNLEIEPEAQRELVALASDVLASSLSEPYYVIVGLTNTDESRPGGGILAGYALIEISGIDYKIINIAPNESFRRLNVDGFEQYYPTFGPSLSTFFDSTLIPDIEVTSEIVSRNIESQIPITPDLFVYLDSRALVSILPDAASATWLEFEQYSLNTNQRNAKTRAILENLDIRELVTILIQRYWEFRSNGSLRITNHDDLTLDAVDADTHTAQTLLFYQSNPLGNKLDRYLRIDTEVCSVARQLLVSQKITYEPPSKVWGYQAGKAKVLQKVKPPQTETTIFVFGQFESLNRKTDAFVRAGTLRGRTWHTYRIGIEPGATTVLKYAISSSTLTSYIDLTASAVNRGISKEIEACK